MSTIQIMMIVVGLILAPVSLIPLIATTVLALALTADVNRIKDQINNT